jgi:aspartate/methionine/tyrosine aminotransferase
MHRMATRMSRLAGQFTESVIRRSTIWSRQHGAVNLAQGFPEDDAPEELKARAIDAILSGRNQYSDTWGTAEIRDAVAIKMNRFYGLDLAGAENVTVTCGATEAMQASLLAVVDPGDEVILFEPSYENFRAQILIARGQPVSVPLVGANFELDRDRLADAFTDRTAAILVNNPNNPCGKVFSSEELELIASLCRRHGVVAIADEVYEHMVYDGLAHRCLATVPGYDENWIVVSSCSKTYHVTGWRIGYAVAPPELTHAVRRCHDFLSGVAATPFQDAAVAALGFDDAYYAWLRDHYDRKRSLMVEVLNRVGLACPTPRGAYYVLADMADFAFHDSVEFCQYLLREVGVAAVPWTSFYSLPEHGRTRLRFTFSKSEDTIHQAAVRLERLTDAPRKAVAVG